MKLYKKQLSGLEQLRRERHLLQYIKKQHKPDSLFSLADLKEPGNGKKAASGTFGIGDALELVSSLAGGGSLSEAALKMGGPALKFAARKFPTRFFLRIAKDIGGSYLKWKLLAGGIFVLKQIFEGRKENRRRAEEARRHNPIYRDRYAGRAKKKTPGASSRY